MSEKLEKLLEELLAEQKKTSLYTLTLERDRLLGALMEAGLGLPLLVTNEFNLIAGATSTIIQPVLPGFVYIFAGKATWFTSLPWWCSYQMWVDNHAPATANFTAVRMPDELSTPDFAGVVGIRAYILHITTNNHIANPAFGMIQNSFLAVSTETWSVIKAVFLDPIVDDIRTKALERSGIPR